MSVEELSVSHATKVRLIYGLLVLAGAVFVSTLFLPVSEGTARFVAALSFGLMSGLWLSHLVHSV